MPVRQSLINARLFIVLILVQILGLPFSAESQERIRIGISTPSFGFLPNYVADKKGFYKKQGLFAEHVVISSSIAIQALLTGDLDYVISVPPAVSAAMKGLPIKLVMVTADKLHFLLLVKPEVTSVADLKDKTIGISNYGSTTHLAVSAILRQFGIDPVKDVKLLPSGGAEGQLAALKAGRIAASFHAAPLDIVGAKLGYKVLLWAKDYLEIPLSAVDISERKIKESPDQVKRFMRGTIEALKYIREQPEPVIDLLADWLKLDNASARAHYNSLVPVLSKDGTMSEKTLRAAIDMELERAQIKRDIPLAMVADATLITQVQKELAGK
jgi:NitT/TauT family transport system substrate-binding protein